jgi:antitoxin component YwqK of YwqJK toxin-antitoxin module
MIEVRKYHYENGNINPEEYYIDGKRHREDGPAIIYYYGNGNIFYEAYYLNGKYHREDGPAYVSYDRNGNIWYKEYWLNDKELTKEEWFNQISIENKLKFAFGIEND